MSDTPSLTFAFLQSRPEAAARVIEELNPADAAALLHTVPARLAAPLADGMAAWAAARILALLPDEQAAGIIRQMVYQNAASLLRLLDADRLQTLLESLPRRLARDFRHSLDYPAKVVGAWMDQSLPSFSLDGSVADGMRFLRHRGSIPLSHLFVVDQNRRFAGVVSIARILQAPSNTPLRQLLDGGIQPISNRAFLASVVDVADWDEHLVLPVVGRRGNVLGGLTRQALRQGLEAQAGAGLSLSPNTMMTHLLTSYFVAFAGLLRVLVQPGMSYPSSET